MGGGRQNGSLFPSRQPALLKHGLAGSRGIQHSSILRRLASLVLQPHISLFALAACILCLLSMQHLATVRISTPSSHASSDTSHSSRQLVSISTASSQTTHSSDDSSHSSSSSSSGSSPSPSPDIKHVVVNGFEGIDEDFSIKADNPAVVAPPSPLDPASEKLFAKAKPRDVLVRHRRYFGWFLDFLQWVGILPPTWHDQYVRRSTAYSAPRVAYPLWWAAPFLSGTGYGNEAISYMLALLQHGLMAPQDVWLTHSGDIIMHGGLNGKATPAVEAMVSIQTASTIKHILPPAESDRPAIIVCHSFPECWRSPGEINYPNEPGCPCPTQDMLDQAAYVIGRSMFETEALPVHLGWHAQKFDEIWVPSEFNVHSFAAAGVPREKIKVLPQGIDVAHFNPDTVTNPLTIRDFNATLVLGSDSATPEAQASKPFIFLSIFKWEKRKGWDLLLKAFTEEFKPEDNVELHIATHAFIEEVQSWREKVRELMVGEVGLPTKETHMDIDLPRVRITDTYIPDELYPQLYKGADALVVPTRGEGWGRPQMEAMAMGLPVISTNWSGLTAFMTEETSYLIPIDGLTVATWDGKSFSDWFKGQNWANPSLAALKQHMRRVYTNRAEAAAKGAAARKHIRQHFTDEVVARTLQRLVHEAQESAHAKLLGRQGAAVDLRRTLATSLLAGFTFWSGTATNKVDPSLFSTLAHISKQLAQQDTERKRRQQQEDLRKGIDIDAAVNQWREALQHAQHGRGAASSIPTTTSDGVVMEKNQHQAGDENGGGASTTSSSTSSTATTTVSSQGEAPKDDPQLVTVEVDAGSEDNDLGDPADASSVITADLDTSQSPAASHAQEGGHTQQGGQKGFAAAVAGLASQGGQGAGGGQQPRDDQHVGQDDEEAEEEQGEDGEGGDQGGGAQPDSQGHTGNGAQQGSVAQQQQQRPHVGTDPDSLQRARAAGGVDDDGSSRGKEGTPRHAAGGTEVGQQSSGVVVVSDDGPVGTLPGGEGQRVAQGLVDKQVQREQKQEGGGGGGDGDAGVGSGPSGDLTVSEEGGETHGQLHSPTSSPKGAKKKRITKRKASQHSSRSGTKASHRKHSGKAGGASKGSSSKLQNSAGAAA